MKWTRSQARTIMKRFKKFSAIRKPDFAKPVKQNPKGETAANGRNQQSDGSTNSSNDKGIETSRCQAHIDEDGQH